MEKLLLLGDEAIAQAALDAGDASQIAPSVRRYTKTVTDTSALFDQRKDALLGLV